MKVIIAEKASMAKKYRESLKNDKRVRVTNSVGHIETLMPIKTHLKRAGILTQDKPYWQDLVSHLPYIPKSFPHVIKEKEVFQNILKSCSNADEIILACDPDREGELIHRNILEILIRKGVKPSKISRIWLHSETEKEIQKAYRERKAHTAYENLYIAAKLREVIDFLVGIELTILYSVKFSRPGKPLSVGRVQSWLLSEIVKRYHENTNFKPENYNTFTYNCKNGLIFNLIERVNKNIRQIFSKEETFDFRVKFGKEDLTISEIDQKPFTSYAPKLYDLKTLQKDAYKHFKFSPEKTLQIAQQLYSDHTLISYPRTECNVITEQEAAELHKAVALIEKFPQYTSLVKVVKEKNPNIEIAKRYLGTLDGHYAIIPVLSYDKDRVPELTPDQEKLFSLIVARFLATLMPPAKGEKTVLFGEIGTELFKSCFTNFTELGWRQHITPDPEEEKEPEFTVLVNTGDQLPGEIEIHDKTTTPPPLYNDGSILVVMERAHLLVQDEKLKKALKEGAGIGTAATRASFIPLLINRNYIKKEKKGYIPTEIGEKMYTILPAALKQADFSAQLEFDLSEIVKNRSEKSFDTFIKETEQLLHSVFKQVKDSNVEIDVDKKETVGTCPNCGADLFESQKAYYCSTFKKDDPNGCKFAIFKKTSGANISKSDLKKLLDGKTTTMKKCKSKAGKEFQAAFKLDENHKISMTFETESLGDCPLCNGAVSEKKSKAGKTFYACNNRDCDFVLWSSFSGVKISKTIVKHLLKKGKTSKKHTFVSSKTGKEFEAYLKLDGKKVVYDFSE